MTILRLGPGDPVGMHRKQARVAGAELTRVNAPAAVPRVMVQPVPLTPVVIEGFVLTYLHARFDNPAPIPQLHRELWADYCLPDPWVADAAPRGHAKSTSITHAALLADLLFRNTDYACIVSGTWSQATEFLGDLKMELEENEALRAHFGVKKFLKDSEDNLIVLMKDGHRFRVIARGSEQKLRGMKWRGKRPSRFVLDDIEDDEQVENKERREKLAKWVLKALTPAGSDLCRVRMVGTIMHFDSFLENALKSPSWRGRRFRAHKDYDDFSEILWPAKYPEARLRALRQLYIDANDPDGYSQEYLNVPISEHDAYFKRSDLLPLTEEIKALMVAGRLRMVKYAGWDFAVSKEDRRDFTRCSVLGVNSDGYKFGIDFRGGKLDTKEIIDLIFDVELAHHPEFHAVEEGVINKAIGPFFYEECRRRQVYPKLYPIVSSKDKRIRARSIQGAIQAHHVFFNKEHAEWLSVENELVKFPKGEKDDWVDSLSILGLLLESVYEAKTDEEEFLDEEEEHMAFVRSKMAVEYSGRNARTGY